MSKTTYTLRLNVTAGAPVGLPAWRQSMTARTWIEVPTTNTLADLNPKNNSTINPNYPSSPEWSAVGGQAAIVTAWCCGCFDQATDTLWLPLGGGHADYAGNEPYKIRLDTDSPVPCVKDQANRDHPVG